MTIFLHLSIPSFLLLSSSLLFTLYQSIRGTTLSLGAQLANSSPRPTTVLRWRYGEVEKDSLLRSRSHFNGFSQRDAVDGLLPRPITALIWRERWGELGGEGEIWMFQDGGHIDITVSWSLLSFVFLTKALKGHQCWLVVLRATSFRCCLVVPLARSTFACFLFAFILTTGGGPSISSTRRSEKKAEELERRLTIRVGKTVSNGCHLAPAWGTKFWDKEGRAKKRSRDSQICRWIHQFLIF